MMEAMFSSEAVTRGVRVQVLSEYAPDRSDPPNNQWFFLYTIEITNEGEEAVQLVSRHWVITDAEGHVEEVRGPGVVGQQPVLAPGESFTYEFRALPTADSSRGGTFMYHSHFDEDRQVGLGLSATFVIEPPGKPAFDVDRTIFLGEWNLDTATGETRPPMQMEGQFPNFFTIGGKAFPATEPIAVRRGQRVLLRIVGGMQFTHPMHLHGMSFRVVAKDGAPLPSPYEADVIDVAPGERYDVLFTADAPGKWVFHCHIGHHLTNDGEAPGGLLTVVEVS